MASNVLTIIRVLVTAVGVLALGVIAGLCAAELVRVWL
jgi:hypothetical protein